MTRLLRLVRRWALTSALQLSSRAALAASLALVTAEWLQLEFPLYAMIAAVIVTELTHADTRRLGWARIVATIVGAVLGALVSYVPLARAVVIGLGIGSAMFVMHAAGYGSAARVAGYTCGIVLLEHHENPWPYAWYRFSETVLGILMALLISHIPMLIRGEPDSRT